MYINTKFLAEKLLRSKTIFVTKFSYGAALKTSKSTVRFIKEMSM